MEVRIVFSILLVLWLFLPVGCDYKTGSTKKTVSKPIASRVTVSNTSKSKESINLIGTWSYTIKDKKDRCGHDQVVGNAYFLGSSDKSLIGEVYYDREYTTLSREVSGNSVCDIYSSNIHSAQWSKDSSSFTASTLQGNLGDILSPFGTVESSDIKVFSESRIVITITLTNKQSMILTINRVSTSVNLTDSEKAVYK